MFVVTLNKKSLKKALIGLFAVVLVFGVGLSLRMFLFEDEVVFLSKKNTIELENTQEMIEYIKEKGYTADIQSAQVKEVKIPKQFDAEFENFDEKIKQADGFSLEKYKNDEVSKWIFELSDYQVEGKEGVAVLLLDDDKLIGSYLLEYPEGIALPLIKRSLPLDEENATEDTIANTQEEKESFTVAQTN